MASPFTTTMAVWSPSNVMVISISLVSDEPSTSVRTEVMEREIVPEMGQRGSLPGTGATTSTNVTEPDMS
jgi:hypothetical protein